MRLKPLVFILEGDDTMNAFLGFVMVLSIAGGILSLLTIIGFAIKKRSKKKPAICFGFCCVAFIAALGYGMASETPEERALRQQQREEYAQDQLDKKNQMEAAISAKKELESTKIEQAKKDAVAQKIYDDQEKYEAWLAAKAQQIYDDQAEYEAWVPKEIELLCKSAIKDGDELIKVEVNEDMSNKNYGSGKFIVLPYFKSQSGARSTELMKISKIMKNLYSEGLPISEVTIFTQDMSGMTIMKSTLSAEKAAVIDWKNVRYSSFDNQLDKFWTVPALRN